jgi:DNA/RNA-binding domain of Phe-tRNA-synthetase-like protein
MVTVAPHPLADLVFFETTFQRPLGELGARPEIAALLSPDAQAPLASDDAVRAAVRDLLRHGGYKPTGRGKPAAEYLLRAVAEGTLGAINAAVDTCNAVSFHSGLPISVVDLDRTEAPLSVAVAEAGTSYVFNASGQTIDVGGLLCLFDAAGPTANAVKDAQRTKTSASTVRTLTVIWGTRALAGRSERTFEWYADLLRALGAEVRRVEAA